MKHLTEAESLAKYGTVAYTAWDEASAQADWNSKHQTLQPQPIQQPVSQPVQTSTQPSTTGNIPTGQPRSAQDLINMGFYGYQGWGDAEAIANYRDTGGAGKGGNTPQPSSGVSGSTSSLLGAFSATPSINLPDIYKNLYESSGISAKELELADTEKKYLEAKAKISDNPFLSASMVDKRLARLANKYESIINPLKTEIATKKADVETQLNLQTKQLDINSESAKTALNYFNTLLETGALTNASAEDIANITRSTGLSSSLIYSAIDANKAKNIKTQVITSEADDGTVTATVINPDTGDIIKQTSLGSIGNKQGSNAGLSVSQQEKADYQENRNNLIGDIQRGATLRALVGHYGGVLSVEEIYRLYNSSNSPYGQAVESLDEVKEGRFIA